MIQMRAARPRFYPALMLLNALCNTLQLFLIQTLDQHIVSGTVTRAFRGKPLPFKRGRKSEAHTSGLMRAVLLLNVFLNDFKWRTAHATGEVRLRPKCV